jgi:hypothetical protein
MNAYEVICADCATISERDWLATSFSDASWHNTMTGHDVVVLATETNTVLLDTAEIT